MGPSRERQDLTKAATSRRFSEAVKWLCHVFGFRQRLFIANHRAQLLIGKDGAVVVVQSSAGDIQDSRHSIMVRVPEVREHHATSKHRGATILKPLADYPYGERQYTAQDLGGHIWTFSQSISDVDPAQWGGKLLENETGTTELRDETKKDQPRADSATSQGKQAQDSRRLPRSGER
jgi:uncharacterized glyoxalase superfamily protein PhnB